MYNLHSEAQKKCGIKQRGEQSKAIWAHVQMLGQKGWQMLNKPRKCLYFSISINVTEQDQSRLGSEIISIGAPLSQLCRSSQPSLLSVLPAFMI